MKGMGLVTSTPAESQRGCGARSANAGEAAGIRIRARSFRPSLQAFPRAPSLA
jgi:hypothetical protein